jgi:hypothetical protein
MGTDRLVSSTAACAVTYFIALVVNVTFTADGPNHMAELPAELARVTSHANALRWSSALGLIGALALAGLAVGLALILAERGRGPCAAVTALAGTSTAAVWLVSFAALAASSIAAETGFGSDAIMGLGILHTTTFLVAFAPAGVLVLAGRRAPGFGRVGATFSIIVGACAVFSAFLVIPVEGEQGPFGLPLLIAFWGVPIWGVAVAFRLLRPIASLPAPEPAQASHAA